MEEQLQKDRGLNHNNLTTFEIMLDPSKLKSKMLNTMKTSAVELLGMDIQASCQQQDLNLRKMLSQST